MPKVEKHNIPGLTELKVLQENPKVALSQQNKEYNWKTDYDWTDPEDLFESSLAYSFAYCA